MVIINIIDGVRTMDLTYFHTFREVAHRQSFTRAAEELGYAQSSVTTQIQKLEKAYDAQLFERYGKGVRLTSAGEELLKIVIPMLDLYQQSKEKLSIQGGGTLSIGTMDSLASYFLPSYIEIMRQHYPGLHIRLQTEREGHIVQKVREGELDIGVIFDNDPSDPYLNWRTIKEEPLALLAKPGHPLTLLANVQLADLEHAAWIMPEDSCNYRIMMEKMLMSHQIPYRIELELGNPEAIKRCILSGGSGISVLPRMAAADEIRRGELVMLPFSPPDFSLKLQMVLHPKKWISHALRAFIDLIGH